MHLQSLLHFTNRCLTCVPHGRMTFHLHECVSDFKGNMIILLICNSLVFRTNICTVFVLFIEKQMQFDTMHVIIHNLPSAPYMDCLCHPSAFYFAIALYFWFNPCKLSNGGHSPAANIYVAMTTRSTLPVGERFVYNRAHAKPIWSGSNRGD